MVSKQQSKQICFWDWIQSRATEIRATLKTTIEMGTDEFNTGCYQCIKCKFSQSII